jgi:hypothetical protein
MVLIKEKYSESDTLKIWIIAEKKFPFHAFVEHKATGEIVEQAARSRGQAVELAMEEMKYRIRNKLLKGGKNEESGN